MPRNVKDILAKLPESRRKAIMDAADAMYVEEMTLAELRQTRFGSQVELAKKLGIGQAALSRLEHRKDMHISKLRKIIGGMGGTMFIIVKMKDRPPVRVNLFAALGRPVRLRRKASVTEPTKSTAAPKTTKSRAKASVG
jgi:hypothetical protein